MVLDASGSAVRAPLTVPIASLATATALTSEILLIGATAESTGVVAAVVDAEGAMRRHCNLPIEGMPALWPRAASSVDRAWAVWAMADAPEHLVVAEIGGDMRVHRTRMQVARPVVALDLAAIEGDLLIACLVGDPAAIELLRLEDGAIAQRQLLEEPRRPVAVSLAVVGARHALLWCSRGDPDLHILWFDRELQTLAPVQQIAAGQSGSRIRSATFLQDHMGRLAIVLQTAAGRIGPTLRAVPGHGPTRVQTELVREFVAAYDWQHRTAGPFQAVEDPGVAYDTGGWLGNRLLLVHGAQDARVSVYEGHA
jgi:hypothetical protein